MGETVPVSRRALLMRLNRAIAPREVRLTRGRALARGEFYVQDGEEVIEFGASLEAYGRKLGVLHAFEVVER
jgi:hypothetical protein